MTNSGSSCDSSIAATSSSCQQQLCFSNAICSICSQHDAGFIRKDWQYSVLNISIEMYISNFDVSYVNTAYFTCTNLLHLPNLINHLPVVAWHSDIASPACSGCASAVTTEEVSSYCSSIDITCAHSMRFGHWQWKRWVCAKIMMPCLSCSM